LAERTGVPGAVLGIWADGDETLAACGVLNTATGVQSTTDSLFQIGSITKVWTATMLMQLVEERRLSLDSTIGDLMPGTRIGAEDIGHQVTIQHLLTHTSGLDGDIFTDTGRGDDCISRYVDLLADATSAFAPGVTYSYCNSGFVLAGRVIEVLDGRSWDESLRERLIGPLGLTKTFTLPEEAIRYRAAIGHDDGAPVRVWGLPRSIGPACLITASAHDLLVFAGMHLDNGDTPRGEPLLSHSSAAAMRQPRTAIPSFDDGAAAIGLGWRLGRWGEQPIICHDGDTIGQSAYLRIAPRARVAVCLLTNTGDSRPLYENLLPEVFSSVAGIAMPAGPGPASETVTEISPERHAGRYERTARTYDVTLVGGLLRATIITTGVLGAITGAPPEQVTLYPADATGMNFVCRSHDMDPWVPVAFGELEDGTPYIFASGRIALRAS